MRICPFSIAQPSSTLPQEMYVKVFLITLLKTAKFRKHLDENEMHLGNKQNYYGRSARPRISIHDVVNFLSYLVFSLKK